MVGEDPPQFLLDLGEVRRIRYPKVAEDTLRQLRWNNRPLAIHKQPVTWKFAAEEPPREQGDAAADVDLAGDGMPDVE